MAIAMKPQIEATTFDIKAQLLDQGRTMDLLAETDLLHAHIKVYAEGGENGLHTHDHEDHYFFVLAGEATFYTTVEEKKHVVGKYQGILLPKGAFYRFHSSGDENLVLLRVGAQLPGTGHDRTKPDGSPIPGDSPDNKQVPVIRREGKYFPTDLH
ncbi:MAG TPA: cupin domain-containing protein [Chloroflexota bacterium]|nr:cupin domain-containing protein [Chloroflexota bacterium]